MADAHVNLEIDVPADTITAALPVLAKALTSAVAAWGALNATQQASPGPAEGPDRVWLELPPQYADPNRSLVVQVEHTDQWLDVLPGIEVRVWTGGMNAHTGASLEFRFQPAGPGHA